MDGGMKTPIIYVLPDREAASDKGTIAPSEVGLREVDEDGQLTYEVFHGGINWGRLDRKTKRIIVVQKGINVSVTYEVYAKENDNYYKINADVRVQLEPDYHTSKTRRLLVGNLLGKKSFVSDSDLEAIINHEINEPLKREIDGKQASELLGDDVRENIKEIIREKLAPNFYDKYGLKIPYDPDDPTKTGVVVELKNELYEKEIEEALRTREASEMIARLETDLRVTDLSMKHELVKVAGEKLQELLKKKYDVKIVRAHLDELILNYIRENYMERIAEMRVRAMEERIQDEQTLYPLLRELGISDEDGKLNAKNVHVQIRGETTYNIHRENKDE